MRRADDLLSPDSAYNIFTVVADRTHSPELVRFMTTGGSPAPNRGIVTSTWAIRTICVRRAIFENVLSTSHPEQKELFEGYDEWRCRRPFSRVWFPTVPSSCSSPGNRTSHPWTHAIYPSLRSDSGGDRGQRKTGRLEDLCEL